MRNQFKAANKGEHPWSSKDSVPTVREIEYRDVGISWLFVGELSDTQPQEWTKLASSTFEDATEVYMVEVIAESDM